MTSFIRHRRRHAAEADEDSPLTRRARIEDEIAPLYRQFLVPRPGMPRYFYRPEPESTTGPDTYTEWVLFLLFTFYFP